MGVGGGQRLPPFRFDLYSLMTINRSKFIKYYLGSNGSSVAVLTDLDLKVEISRRPLGKAIYTHGDSQRQPPTLVCQCV